LVKPSGASPIPSLSILTNLPQIVLSVLFFLYTSLLTIMVSYSKYNRPSATPKQLAKPARDLPFHYTILVSAFATTVHWMASQAFFLTIVQVLSYPPDSTQDNRWGLYVDAGFSPIAIVFTLIVGGAAFVALLAMGARRY
jgi:hypothetical protein